MYTYVYRTVKCFKYQKCLLCIVLKVNIVFVSMHSWETRREKTVSGSDSAGDNAPKLVNVPPWGLRALHRIEPFKLIYLAP
jgi:hypothetical protein|eukprot:m.14963 g.14963  ORF g.14963 m.14963 type:complete len:81 (-) comp8514_c0_seq1:1387-1629(-)